MNKSVVIAGYARSPFHFDPRGISTGSSLLGRNYAGNLPRRRHLGKPRGRDWE